MIEPPKSLLILKFKVQIFTENGQPCARMIHTIKDMDKLIELVKHISYEKPIAVIPVFSDPIRSWGILNEKGIINYNKEKEEYFFTLQSGPESLPPVPKLAKPKTIVKIKPITTARTIKPK